MLPGGRRRITHLGTASGDQRWFNNELDEASRVVGFSLTHLNLFPMPNLENSEDQRRPLVHRLVADGTLGETHCTDDGVGLGYHGTRLVEAVSEDVTHGIKSAKIG